MLLKIYYIDFIMDLLKEVEDLETQSEQMLMNKIRVDNKHCNKNCIINTIFSISVF